MAIVVTGRAMINPKKPNSTPNIESESSIMAGLSPILRPIILGTIRASVVTWITANTMSTPKSINQILPPVSILPVTAKNITGTNPNVCR